MLQGIISAAFVVLLLTACAPSPTGPVPISTPFAVLSVSPTPQPTDTSVPTASAFPRATSAPALTPSPLPGATPTLAHTRTATPAPTPEEPLSKRYPSAFGIDYAQPLKYLQQGEQTRFSNPEVMGVLLKRPKGMALLGEIVGWMRKEFRSTAGGGVGIGVSTTEQLLKDRLLTGCHDWALVYASFARALGYPAVIVDAAGIPWMAQAQSGKSGSAAGHVFVEVFISDQWVLIDSTNGWYVENGYDPTNPVIPLRGGFPGETSEWYGFYVMRKGLDTWDYTIRSNAELVRLMQETARQVPVKSLANPRYTFGRFQ